MPRAKPAPVPFTPEPSPPEKAARPKPFDREQHVNFAANLIELLADLKAADRRIHTHYPRSTEPARAIREMLRQAERLRAGLNAKFFTEGRSTQGTTPYYPPGGAAVTDDEEDDDDAGECDDAESAA